MHYSSKQYAQVLYDITIDKPESELQLALNNFVELLAKNGDLGKTDQIFQAYRKYFNKLQGIQEMEISVAREIPNIEATFRQIARYFSPIKLEPKVVIDNSLVGGVKMKIEDDVIDGSLAKKLELLKHQLTK